jgi:hypothetical protein
MAIALMAMAALAVLDLIGAFAAKEAVTQRSWAYAALGVTAFMALFWVYASSLQYAELAPVTLGWVVALQVGVLLLDRFRYEVPISGRAWLAVVVILAGQAYLLVGPYEATSNRGDSHAAVAATSG